MPLFDAYIMVDWSGSDWRRSGRQDCIWIAHGRADAAAPVTTSPPSRTEAEQMIRAELQSAVTRNKGRVLLCADFGYGYPAGFASLLANSCSAEPAAVACCLAIFCANISMMTSGQNPPNNRTTAATASKSLTTSTPHYQVPLREVRSGVSLSPVIILCVPQNKPAQPFICGNISIGALRVTDGRAKSDTPFGPLRFG